jgi:hypothetical protein
MASTSAYRYAKTLFRHSARPAAYGGSSLSRSLERRNQNRLLVKRFPSSALMGADERRRDGLGEEVPMEPSCERWLAAG